MHSLLLLAVVGIGLCSAGVFQSPVKNIQTRRNRMIREGTWANYLHHKNLLRLQNKQDRAVVGQPVNDYEDLAYLGNATSGTPPQQFLVILDTGSANYWIPDSTCSGTQCRNKNKFDSTSSSTYRRNGQSWSISYGTGSARGFLGIDSVAFGGIGDNQLIVPNTTFGQATSIADFFADEPIEGILGLAFQSLAANNVVPPLINAINQGLLDQPIFTVWLAQRGIGDNVRNGGLYTYGGLDMINCGPVTAYQPLSSATYFQFRMAGIGLGTYSSSAGWEVISDTGTSFIAGPTAIVQQLARQVNATYVAAEETYYMSSCSTAWPTLDITIGSNTYSIQAKNYVVDAGDHPLLGRRCYFAVSPFSFGGFGPAWILGDPFIRQICNVYDIGQRRIGFAPAITP